MKLDYLQKEAKNGNADALYTLGAFFLTGEGVPKNRRKAEELWSKAMKTDNAPVLRRIGLAYLEGKYIGRNITKGLKLIKRATELGNPWARTQYKVLRLFEKGETNERP